MNRTGVVINFGMSPRALPGIAHDRKVIEAYLGKVIVGAAW
jgi:hypothetical protein